MNLHVQIMTLLFSFLYGIFFSVFLTLNYKLIYNDTRIYRIIITFLFVTANVLIYFLILRKINNGVFHVYEILMIAFGFYVEKVLNKIIKKNILYKNKNH